MSNEPVIQIAGLGKQYRLGADYAQRYTTLRDTIMGWFKPGGRKGATKTIWAIKDLDLEIGPGELVGIIGRNGAGKSTLLKLIAQITRPTAGEIKLRGRVASLLEVGTGFHPELTGRENIYVSGAILGLRRAEINAKFEQIVEFAGVRQFLDTPIKRYSSGMHVRLAFSVAAHLDQDILLVDEVLAVGDAEFREKCLRKMDDVARNSGRTVLFVSHNNAAVSSLCERGVVLDGGQMQFDGAIHDALNYYTNAIRGDAFNRTGSAEHPHVQSVYLDQQELNRGNLRVEVRFSSPYVLDPPRIGLVLHTATGQPVFGFNTQMDQSFKSPPMKDGVLEFRLNQLPLHSGAYKVTIWFGDKHGDHDVQHDVLAFEYVSERNLGMGYAVEAIGPVEVDASWCVKA